MPIFWSGAGAHVASLQASQSASDASAAARRSESAVARLESRIERLALVTEALWTLLEERVGITEGELLDRIREIDLSDGVLDGRVRHGTFECPHCGRVLSRRNLRCLYCGVEVEKPPFAGV